jgi:hypothetical protein
MSTRKRGPVSVKDYRTWSATHGRWRSHWLRPEPEDVNRAMTALSAAFGQTEAELVKPLMARIAYTPGERAAVFADVRQAITVVATAAWRVAQDGGWHPHPDTIVGEIAYEPIISGPRSVAVMNVLERTQLQVYVRAVSEELVTMEAEHEQRKAEFEAVRQAHKKVPKSPDAPKSRYGKDYTWEPAWTKEEILAWKALRRARSRVEALRPVAKVLSPDGKVRIQTRYEQKINRRWNAVTFGVEQVGHRDTREEITYPAHPDWVDEDGVFEAAEPEMTRTTWRRARMFKPWEGRELELGDLAGYDVASSQYQILSIFLGDGKLEQQLQLRLAVEALAVVRGHTEVKATDVEVVRRLALCSILHRRYQAMQALQRTSDLTLTPAIAREAMRISEAQVHVWLTDLVDVGLLQKDGVGRYVPAPEFAGILRGEDGSD